MSKEKNRFSSNIFKEFSLIKLLPNCITLLSICLGVTGIKYALIDKYYIAVFMIYGAAILDGLDGRIARALNSSSEFGAELDSLADFINFGVAPGFIVYLSLDGDFSLIGWFAALFYIMCMCMRLARFNCQNKTKKLPAGFFVGVPAPLGAFYVLCPITYSFVQDNFIIQSSFLKVTLLWVTGMLLISRIPVFSMKSTKITQKAVLPLFIFFSIFAIFMIIKIEIALVVITVGHFFTIPFSIISFKKLKHLSGLKS